MAYTTIEGTIGSTPLVELLRSTSENARNRGNIVLGKWECGNPSGSIKDRVLKMMIRHAEERGDIRPGDTLIEATGGNTGISLAMMAAARGYRAIVVMPESTNYFKQQSIAVYGANIVLTPKSGGIEYARDLAEQMAGAGEGVLLDQFNNSDNPLSHYETTGPEIWSATRGKVTHFVCPMGTTGTIMGVSRFLKEKNKKVKIIGVEPANRDHITGMYHWQENQRPRFYDKKRVDRIEEISQACAEYRARRMASEEGIFCGLSSACACEVALSLSETVDQAVIVFMMADRGNKYFSSGFFPF